MLDHLGETEGAALVDGAVSDLLASGKIKELAAGRMGFTTTEIGDMIAESVAN